MDPVRAFRLLDTKRDRTAALEALIHELDPYEWRSMQSALSRRSFSCDIVGRLPIELVTEVFTYLDVAAPYRLQAVSKRWNTVLRDTDIVKKLLRQWYTRNDSPLPGESTLKDNDYAVCQLKAEHMHRFRGGNPVRTITIPTRIDSFDNNFLCGDYICWVSDASRRSIEIRNLRTGQASKAACDGRQQIRKVVLSEHLVVFTSFDGRFHVQSLASGEQKSLNLPRYVLDHVSCRDRTVVCGGVAPGSTVLDIYTIDFDEFRGRSLQLSLVDSPPFIHRITKSLNDIYLTLLLDPMTRNLFVFTSEGQFEQDPDMISPNVSIHYSRFDVGGKLLVNGSFKFDGISSIKIDDVRPVDAEGCFALSTFCQPSSDLRNAFSKILEFNTKTNTFIDPPQCPKGQPEEFGLIPGVDGLIPWLDEISWWKDTFFEERWDTTGHKAVWHVGTNRKLSKTWRGPVDRERSRIVTVYVNGLFVVLFDGSRNLIEVHRFTEDNVHVIGQQPDVKNFSRGGGALEGNVQ
ncbi:hypothetical protein BCR34DRAFT_576545 [Clohesyomyces aquaticus]|uniref:F-box domain-containing protein n=1 Tax=Clohesyomyces aquaticus TaxID=1231657 RepID=A0A1Y1YNI7_9PLEO|nr:hypothetical protein BCR34DRAFT_576545 [Clohesyomyces aquaticus]